MSMAKPRNWKEIQKIREQLWKEMFDEVNESFDQASKKALKAINEARLELHKKFEEKIFLYRKRSIEL